jgi:hypothetical protein
MRWDTEDSTALITQTGLIYRAWCFEGKVYAAFGGMEPEYILEPGSQVPICLVESEAVDGAVLLFFWGIGGTQTVYKHTGLEWVLVDQEEIKPW